MRFLDYSLFFFLGMVFGALLFHLIWGGSFNKIEPMPEAKQSISLEQIREVSKLITVEGEYSNIHEYKDFGYKELSFLSKKALVRIKAKVSVGYNLDKAEFIADENTKTLTIRNLPEPEILSIDHNLEYYDIQEGMFNSFNERELSSIGSTGLAQLRKNVERGPLMAKAREQGLERLGLIRVLAEGGGWKVIVESEETMPVDADSSIQPLPLRELDKKPARQGDF